MSLPLLAAVSDVEARLGRTLSGSDEDRMTALLTDASAKVRSFTGQQISQSETTDRVRITNRDGKIRLPQYPIVSITSMVGVESDIPIPYYFDGITLWGGWVFINSNIGGPINWNRRRHGIVVDVTYTHGYDPVPDEIIALVCGVAARAFGTDPSQTGITQEGFEGYSYSMGSAAAAGGLGLLPAEKEVLADYMAPNAGPILTYG